jgi:GT2 family glycosyltransferase
MATFTTIIISWNTRELLRTCLRTLFEQPFDGQVIVIDNASSDGSAAMVKEHFSDVELVENSENIGFAKACNQGAEMATSDYLLLLNSDCEIHQADFFARIDDVFHSDPEIGVVGPKVLYPNGTLQSAGQAFVSLKKLVKHQLLFQASPLFARKCSESSAIEPFDVDYVSGSCLFIRRDIVRQIGLFTEALVMYTEDMELCYRVHKSGYRVVITPAVSVVHLKSKSTNQNLVNSLRFSTRNNCIFIKNQSGLGAAFLALCIYAGGTAMRVLLAFFRRSTKPGDWFKLLLHIPGMWREIRDLKI